MSVWYVVPSKRPVEEAHACLSKWIQHGYQVMIQRDPNDAEVKDVENIVRPYQGYSDAVNHLVAQVIQKDLYADWIVTGGDDIDPDLNHSAEEIAAECSAHFNGTFGVMQPIGDKWRCDISRICGNPWMGRDFCQRINQGRGPMWPEYFHMRNDEEMQEVTLKLGVLWQRPDLSQFHHHWMRESGSAPVFLARANSQSNWDEMGAIFFARKAKGFPGHEPLQVEVV